MFAAVDGDSQWRPVAEVWPDLFVKIARRIEPHSQRPVRRHAKAIAGVGIAVLVIGGAVGAWVFKSWSSARERASRLAVEERIAYMYNANAGDSGGSCTAQASEQGDNTWSIRVTCSERAYTGRAVVSASDPAEIAWEEEHRTCAPGRVEVGGDCLRGGRGRTSSGPAPSRVVTVAELRGAYKENEAAGHEYFKDRVVKVRGGRVEEVSVVWNSQSVRVEDHRGRDVVCKVAEGWSAAKLKKGQRLDVVGRDVDRVLWDFFLDDCRWFDPSVEITRTISDEYNRSSAETGGNCNGQAVQTREAQWQVVITCANRTYAALATANSDGDTFEWREVPGEREAGCSAMQGIWELSTQATEAKRTKWIGAKGRYEVELAVEGCKLRGSARKLKRGGQTIRNYEISGTATQGGSAEIRYRVPGRKIGGVWSVDIAGGKLAGRFETATGDTKGTVVGSRRGEPASTARSGSDETAAPKSATERETAHGRQAEQECDEEAPAGRDGCQTGYTCSIMSTVDGWDVKSQCVPNQCFPDTSDRPLFITHRDLDACKEAGPESQGRRRRAETAPAGKGLGEVCQTSEDCRPNLRCVEPHQHSLQENHSCEQLCSTEADCTAPEFAERGIDPYCDDRGVCN